MITLTAAQKLITYSAGQLANALCQSPQAIRDALAQVPPSGQVIVKGRPAAVWPLADLPPALRSDLDGSAHRQGFPDADSMLSRPAAPEWQPRVALALASQAAQDKAIKLRTVFEPFLRVADTEARTQADFEAAGVAAYQRVFHHPISGRHFRYLYTRTLGRDRNHQNWMRVELYLDDNITPARQPDRPDRAAHTRHESALGDTVRTLENPARPTADDLKFLFDAAFRHLETSRADKRTLIDWLFKAVPALAPSRAALKTTFNRKLRIWTDAGGLVDALEDRRRTTSGNFRRPDFTDDLKKIRAEAILHGGNETLAYRKLRQSGQLSDAIVNYYKFDPRRNKSYLPQSIREEITREVEMCRPLHHGPLEAKKRGPYIPRDWSDVEPAAWFSGDDTTLNNYFYFYDADGRLHIERGECLLLHDLRTGYLLHYVLIAGKYNSRHIRSLILAVHDKHGLPHQGYYFENSVWKARIITDIAAKDSFHWREVESGLAAFNLQVRHAQRRNPRSKVIEGLIRILQDRQRAEPGYCGTNEMTQPFERMKEFRALALAGKADPADKLLEMAQWTNRLDQIFGDFNEDPQNGKLLRGARPREAWQAGLDKKPLRKLPDDARYLLATHCKKVKVRQEGIVLNIGKDRMLFANEQTGPLIGRDVLAYYSVETPELLTVSDLNRQNHFTVKAISLPAMSATNGQFHTVHAQIAGHQKAARAIYGAIPHQVIATITRDDSISQADAALGRFHNAETEQFRHEEAAAKRTLRKIQLASPGHPIPAGIRNPDRVFRGITIEDEWRAEQAAADSAGQDVPAPSASGAPGQKIYVLDPPAASAPTVQDYWRLWARIEKIKPGLNRHALTQKAIHCHPTPRQMTPMQLAKMCDVFTAIIRDSKKASAA